MSRALSLGWPLAGGRLSIVVTSTVPPIPPVPSINPLTISGPQAQKLSLASAFTGVPSGNSVSVTNNSAVPLEYIY